jgi:hypothetical protein
MLSQRFCDSRCSGRVPVSVVSIHVFLLSSSFFLLRSVAAYNCLRLSTQLNRYVLAETAPGIHDCEISGMGYR